MYQKICLFPFTEKVFVPNKRKYVPIPASLKSSFTEAKPVEFVLDKKETRSSSKTLSEKTNLDNFSTTENKQQTKTIKEPKASLEESLASKFQEQKKSLFWLFLIAFFRGLTHKSNTLCFSYDSHHYKNPRSTDSKTSS